MKESWQPVPEHDTYEVSDLGRVRGPRGLLKPVGSGDGYVQVFLPNKRWMIHRLVAAVFIGPANGLEVNHEDSDRRNNRLSNLSYMTTAENQRHACRKGVCKPPGSGKLTLGKAQQIKNRALQGERGVDLAKEFGVSRQTISSICKGRIWVP
jgi:hypothetical protein